MTKRQIKLDGFAYRQGDRVEVYLRVNGKYVKAEGSLKAARRSWGRETRQMSEGALPASQYGLAMFGTSGRTS